MKQAQTRTKAQRRDLSGFTLVELLVVVGIIAVLVAILVPVFNKVKRASYGASTSAQIAAIATGIQAYYGDFHAYPGPLPNNQLGIAYYGSSGAYASPSPYVYVLDPNNGNAKFPLKLATTSGSTTTYTPFDPTQIQHITGAENLVLGLLGGLDLQFTPNSSPPTIQNFAYNPQEIFPDNTNPNPKGPMSLNPNNPKRWGAYLQVRPGDISNCQSMGTPTVFTDEAQRTAYDSIIPEFVDKFSQPMPVLYMRANVGAPGIVTYGGKDENGSNAPVVNGQTVSTPFQYDLSQIIEYTQPSPSDTMASGAIGTTATSATANHHGLEDIAPKQSGSTSTGPNMNDSITQDWSAVGMNETTDASKETTVAGANAMVYLKDPSTSVVQSDGTTATTNAMAHPRQKDGFILISAGPDGVYGTADDIIYPGTLNP